MDPRNEANARAQRIAEQARFRHDETARQFERTLQLDKPTARRPRLSEADRRRIWNGYQGGILAPTLEVTNRSKIGRDFLIRIQQVPNWNLILGAGGKVVGQVDDQVAMIE
jgi:hypothetical protein